MNIKRVTLEYDNGTTYVAEGEDARTWRKWMQGAEDMLRKKGWPVWSSWTRVETANTGEQAKGQPVVDGPDEPIGP